MKILPDLHLAFDVGHSSIGWAVLQTSPSGKAQTPDPTILGTGAVTFGADDCLAVKRRKNRQARRHARSTRQRIARMEQLLIHLGVMTAAELKEAHQQAGGDSFAWRLAAEILAAARAGKSLPKLGWPELWDILRWYAHNRGYFAPPWANRGEEEGQKEEASDNPTRAKKGPDLKALLEKGGEIRDEDKKKIALGLMHGEHPELRDKSETMAETIAAYTKWYEQQVALWHQAKRADKPRHFKGLNAAFPRDGSTGVWAEVRALLTALKGQLPKLDDAFIRTLTGDDVDPLKNAAQQQAWKTIPCGLKLPKRYYGGLLFGQMIPRFDNRIIGVCPVHFARRRAELLASGFSEEDAKREAAKQSKLPSKATPEFLRFRWALQLANVFGARDGEAKTHPMTADERRALTDLAEREGALSKKEFRDAIKGITGWKRDNLESIFLEREEEAKDALILNPAQARVKRSDLSAAMLGMPKHFRNCLTRKLNDGRTVSVDAVRAWLTGEDAVKFDGEVQKVLERLNTRKGKKQSATTREELLSEELKVDWNRVAKGRAPYARPVLRQAHEEVMKGWDPRAEKTKDQPRGCLCQTNELKEAQLQRRVEEQTNNHLIRHRLLILGGELPKPNATPKEERRRFKGLLHDLIHEFANGDKGRIAGMTIEVASDLRDLSGKTREEQKTDMNNRLRNFKGVAKTVEDACARRRIPVTAGLIRKARVAEDLKWTCPYTKSQYCIDDLIDGRVDKDHIIPYANRQSDSLDSLVLTFGEVNRMKGKRTAVEFIKEFGGAEVPGTFMPCGKLARLSIQPLSAFKEYVDSLDTRGTHEDDRARKRRRKDRLKVEHYEEKEFTPRDLTVTRHLVRMGAQVLQRNFPPEQRPPVVSLPGSVTSEVRKAWRLTACLELANPAVIEEVEERNEKTGKMEKVRRAKKKDDIRGITHLHHALDACVLGLASLYFPRHGRFWATMVKAGVDHDADDDRRLWLAMTRRRPTAEEAALLKATGLYKQNGDGRMNLDDLPEPLKNQIRQRLAEKRVVQHIPADMSGVKVEENTRGVIGFDEEKGRVLLRQRSGRDAKTGLQTVKPTDEAPGKLLGLKPANGEGKLAAQKGVRVITDNFGVAILDHAPEDGEKFVVIPWHRVWHRLEELKTKNGGKRPWFLRIGDLVEVPNASKRSDYRGQWMIRGVTDDKRLGVVVDLTSPDQIDPRVSGSPFCKRNVSLETLLVCGLHPMKASLAGLPPKIMA